MLILQWPVEGSFGCQEDLELRHDAEEIVDRVLTAGGLGSCDGGDIGNGKMNVFCEVAAENAVAACKAIVPKLDEEGLIDALVIAFMDDDDEDAEPNVLHPEGYTGAFSVL